MTDTTTETAAAIIAKAGPPATVSLATVMGYQVSELVLWATLVYTILLICQKLWQIYKEARQ
jgi:hypothetical protein